MSIFQKSGSTIWTYEFVFRGQRIRESSGTHNKALARQIERKRHLELQEGAAGVKRAPQAGFFAADAERFQDERKATLGEKSNTVRIDGFNLAHLLPFFGKLLVPEITPTHIGRYQQERLADDAASKTINLEIGTLRSVLSESGHWSRIARKVTMLEVDNEGTGVCLAPEVSEAVLAACAESESRALYPYAMLLHESGSRSGVMKRVKWERVDFLGGGLRFGRDKTSAGTGRTIPLTQRAMAVLSMWAENFPKRRPGHYVFPAESYRQEKGGRMVVTSSNPSEHMESFYRSWETALERAGEKLELEAAVVCRFHDLRHTAISRMIANKTPMPIIAALVGWSATTMWQMAKRYGHYDDATLLQALQGISGEGYPLKSPLSSTGNASQDSQTAQTM